MINKAIKYHFNKEIKEKIKLDNGWKESYLLVLSDNQKVVFRACRNYTEKFFYDTVNKAVGKICPEVYVVDGSCENYEKTFQISEYLEGTPLCYCLKKERDKNRKIELYYKIGEIVACINKIKISSDHPYVNNQYSWKKYFVEKLLKTQLTRIVKNDLITNAEIEQICGNMLSKNISSDLSFLHRDIRPANIILNDNKLFIIDSETCEFGDPLNELARIKLEWHYWEMYDTLLSGYKNIMDIDSLSELIDYYQLEWLAELLDMHYNHECMNSTTPYFENRFTESKKRILSY